MKSSAAFLSLAVLAVTAGAADTQSPGVQTPNTQTPGVQTPNTQVPGVSTPGATRDGQTPSMQNPGSTQSPAPTPGTEFPSRNPTAPNQAGTAQRTRRQILGEIRAAVIQVPSAGAPGTLPGTQAAPIQDLRVFRRNGTIVLTGTVGSQAEKDAAGARASQKAGGQEILNQLKVK